MMQMRTCPFENDIIPGHLNMLVDTFNVKVVRTNQVPPQADWWREIIQDTPRMLSFLPAEVLDSVSQEVYYRKIRKMLSFYQKFEKEPR